MIGVLAVGGLWILFILVRLWWDRHAGRDTGWLNRESVAVVIALLGTVSIAPQIAAEEIIRDPLVIERVIRGGLAILALLIAGPVLVHRLRNRPSSNRYLALTALTVYLSIAALTVIYSVAPLVTAAKAFELGAALAAVAAGALASDGRHRLRNMVTLVISLEGVLLGATVIGFFAFPQYFWVVNIFQPGFIYAEIMGSPVSSSNALSATGALLSVYAIARLLEVGSIKQRAFWSAITGLGVTAIALASGRQGVLMFAVGTLVLLWFVRRTLFLMLIGPVSAGLLWVNWDSAFRVFARGQPQLLGNLTGRLTWWQATIEAWLEHPWTGYGYGAGGRFVALANIGRGQTSNVHNGYLEALVGVGVMGLVPLLIALGLVISWSINALHEKRDTPLAILIVPLAMHTFIDLGFGAWLQPDFILLACLAGIADWWRGQLTSTTKTRRSRAADMTSPVNETTYRPSRRAIS